MIQNLLRMSLKLLLPDFTAKMRQIHGAPPERLAEFMGREGRREREGDWKREENGEGSGGN